MVTFDDSAKEDVRSRIDIAALIGRYITLKPSGQVLKGLCPFHKEKAPSFQVNPARGFFHCFGCGKGGDVFKFVEEIEGVGFSEALAMLAEECGVELPKYQSPHGLVDERVDSPGTETGRKLSKKDLLSIHETAARFFYATVKTSPAAVEYFKTRGLKPETVRNFRLGYAQDSWTALIDHCAGRDIPGDVLTVCGLAIQKETGRCYDRFRNRIIFTLMDLSGRPIGFAGRGMEKDAQPKYLNSPETPLYHKKMYLYGLHASRAAIKEKKHAIVVEGYMDYLSLHQEGIQNVVATSGTALTPEHAQLLLRFTRAATLLFDGDAAGQSAAEKAVFTMIPHNIDLSVLILPNNEDPDSYIKKHGRESFEQLLSKAVPWMEFIIDRMITIHNGTTPHGKSVVADALLPLYSSMPDIIVKEHFKQKISEKLGVDRKLLGQKFRENSVNDHSLRSRNEFSPDERYASTLEGSFLRILLTQPALIAEARTYVAPETLTDGISGDIYSLILRAYDRNPQFASVADMTNDPEMLRLLSLLQVKETVTEHIHEELVQKIIHLRKKYLRRKERECRLQMKQEPHRREELLQMIHEYMNQQKELDGGE